MDFSNYNDFYDPRTDFRETCSYRQTHIKIKPVGESEYSGAEVVNRSTYGIGLITPRELSVGTRLELNMDDTYFATGEVVSAGTECKDMDMNGMKHVGVHFIDKTNWPF